MSGILLVAPEGGAAQRSFRAAKADEPSRKPTLLSDLDAVADTLAGRRWSVVALDAAFGRQAVETALRTIAKNHPALVRLVLCAEQAEAQQISGAHQAVPWSGDWSVLARIFAGADAVAAQLAGNERLAALVAKLDRLPSPPMLYFDLRAELQSHQGKLDDLARITARDPALVAQVLKLVNSGFYGLPRTVSNLTEAIRLVGSDTLISLVLAAHVFSGMPPPGIRLEVLWQHSIRVASLARQIAAIEGLDREAQGACAVAGVLHDIGLMILLEHDASTYLPLWRGAGGDEARISDAERATYGLTHGELGGLVLRLWNLPSEIVQAVADSHSWDAPATAAVTRAVMTAEWLLGPGRAAGIQELELPPFLGQTTRERLGCWAEVRDDVDRNVA